MGEILKDLKSKKYNPTFESIKMVSSQFKSALTQNIIFPPSYKSIKNVVLSGMGGSALGAHVLKALDVSKVPFLFYNGYVPPRFMGKETLFIASSYSGNTEEVLASLNDATNRGAKIVGVCAGGKLEKKLKSKKLPLIKFDTSLNPSAQPRDGLGYALGALFNIFTKLDLIDYKTKYLSDLVQNFKMPSLNKVDKLSEELKGYAPIVVSSEFLEGNAHIFVNQLNETCKVFSEYHSIPELNHHLMEGLVRPEANKKALKFLFIESDLYSPKIKKRFAITKDVVTKNNIKSASFKVSGKTDVEQVLNFLVFGSLTALVLAVKYKEDPTAIPWVDYFKKKL